MAVVLVFRNSVLVFFSLGPSFLEHQSIRSLGGATGCGTRRGARRDPGWGRGGTSVNSVPPVLPRRWPGHAGQLVVRKVVLHIRLPNADWTI